MRITSKGQVTIPQDIRDTAGLLPGTDVDFVIDEAGVVRLVKAEPAHGKPSRGERIVARLRGSATANQRMTTDEIMALMRGED